MVFEAGAEMDPSTVGEVSSELREQRERPCFESSEEDRCWWYQPELFDGKAGADAEV